MSLEDRANEIMENAIHTQAHEGRGGFGPTAECNLVGKGMQAATVGVLMMAAVGVQAKSINQDVGASINFDPNSQMQVILNSMPSEDLLKEAQNSLQKAAEVSQLASGEMSFDVSSYDYPIDVNSVSFDKSDVNQTLEVAWGKSPEERDMSRKERALGQMERCAQGSLSGSICSKYKGEYLNKSFDSKGRTLWKMNGAGFKLKKEVEQFQKQKSPEQGRGRG